RGMTAGKIAHACAHPLSRGRTEHRSRSHQIDMRSNAGFTLFEALVAVALMGLILGALATVTSQWLPNWNRGLARVQRSEQVAIALDRLAADLGAAEHVFPNSKIRRPLFDGSELAVTL